MADKTTGAKSAWEESGSPCKASSSVVHSGSPEDPAELEEEGDRALFAFSGEISASGSAAGAVMA